MSPLTQILLLAVGSYFLRVSFIALASRVTEISPRIETALSMIPPAVLAAIAFESLIFDDDSLRGLNEWHIALAIASVVAYRTKSAAWCVGIGMPALWITSIFI
jgi:branched-subunit amino acid transport protein